MSTLENLFMQIFDRKNWIINQLNAQLDSYDQSLASYLLINRINPPSWLRTDGLGFEAQNADLNELKNKVVSDIVFPPPLAPPKTDGKIVPTTCEPDQSLLRFQRSRMRQRALEQRNSARQKLNKRAHTEDTTNRYTGRVTRSRSSCQRHISVQETLESAKVPTSAVRQINCSSKSSNLDTLINWVGRDDLEKVSGTQIEVPPEPAPGREGITSIDVYTVSNVQTCAAISQTNEIVPDMPYAAHTMTSFNPTTVLEHSQSRPPSSTYVEPKQLNFDNLEECSMKQSCSCACTKENRDSCSEARACATSKLDINKSVVIQNDLMIGADSRSHADGNEHVSDEPKPALSLKYDKNVDAGLTDLCPGECLVAANTIDHQSKPSTTDLFGHISDVYTVSNIQTCAAISQTNELVPDMPYAAHTMTSLNPTTVLEHSQSRPPSSTYVEPKQLNFDNLEECSMKQSCSCAFTKENRDSCSEARACATSKLDINKSVVIQNDLKIGADSRSHADGNEHVSDEPKPALSLKCDKNVDAGLTDLCPGECLVAANTIDHQSKPSTTDLFGHISDVYTVSNIQTCAAISQTNELVPDMPYAAHTMTSLNPTTVLEHSQSRPPSSTYVEPKQLNFDNLEECSMKQSCSHAFTKENRDSCSEAIACATSKLDINKSVVIQNDLKIGVDSQSHADGNEHVSDEPEAALSLKCDKNVDAGLTDLCPGESLVAANTFDHQSKPSTTDLFGHISFSKSSLFERLEPRETGVHPLASGSGKMSAQRKTVRSLTNHSKSIGSSKTDGFQNGLKKSQEMAESITNACGNTYTESANQCAVETYTGLQEAAYLKRLSHNKINSSFKQDRSLKSRRYQEESRDITNSSVTAGRQAITPRAQICSGQPRETPYILRSSMGHNKNSVPSESNGFLKSRRYQEESRDITNSSDTADRQAITPRAQICSGQPKEAPYILRSSMSHNKNSVPSESNGFIKSRRDQKEIKDITNSSDTADTQAITPRAQICSGQPKEAPYILRSSMSHNKNSVPSESNGFIKSRRDQKEIKDITNSSDTADRQAITPRAQICSGKPKEAPYILRSSMSHNKNSVSNGSRITREFQEVEENISNVSECSWPMYKRRKIQCGSNNVLKTFPRLGRVKPLPNSHVKNSIRQILCSEDGSLDYLETENFPTSLGMGVSQSNIGAKRTSIEMLQNKKRLKKEVQGALEMLKSSCSTLQIEEHELKLKENGQGGLITEKHQHVEVEAHIDVCGKKQADGASLDCNKEAPKVVDAINANFDVTRLSTLDNIPDFLERMRSPVTERVVEEKKYDHGEDGMFSSYFAGSTHLEGLEAGAGVTSPELERLCFSPEYESSLHKRDLISFGTLDSSYTTNEQVNFFEQLSKSTSLPSSLSLLPAIQRMPDYSLPKGLLKQMDLPNFLTCNGVDAKQPMSFEDITHSDVGCNFSAEIVGSLQGRSYSYTPPLGKLRKKSTGSSLANDFSLNAEYSCFRIDEDTCIDEGNGCLHEVVSPYENASSSREKIVSLEREVLAEVTSAYNKSYSFVSEAGNCQDRGSLDSGITELNLPGYQTSIEKTGIGHDQDNFFKNKDKENQSYSIDGTGVRRLNGSLQNKFNRPQSSRKQSEKKRGESLREKHKPNNIVSNIASFLPLVLQKQQTSAICIGRKDIKVKALEAAETAKRLEEERQKARKMRKEAARLEREKMEKEKMRQLELKKKRDEEERKKKEADIATRKRMREEEEEKEKERKKRCIEEARKHQVERKEKLRAEKLEKEIRQKAAEKERNIKVLAEEARKNPKLQKTKKTTNDRTKMKSRTTKVMTSDAGKSSMAFERNTIFSVPDHFEKVVSISDSLCQTNEGGFSMNEGNQELQSYEISPYQSSDDEEEEDDDARAPNRKFIPQWAREIYSSRSLEFLHHFDPNNIFLRERCCNKNETQEKFRYPMRTGAEVTLYTISEDATCTEKPLRNLVASAEWRSLPQSKSVDGEEIGKIIQGLQFWDTRKEILEAVEPLVKILRMVDGEGSTMGYIYDGMDRAKEAIKKVYNNDLAKYDPLWKIINNRWSNQLHSPLHAVAAFLNPQLLYSDRVVLDEEVRDGFREVFGRMMPTQKGAIAEGLGYFGGKHKKIFDEISIGMLKSTHPRVWWTLCGHALPNLRQLAMKVLSQPCSASACERNWSAFEAVHTKKRNRLEPQKLHDLVYVKLNLHLQKTSKDKQEKDSAPIFIEHIEGFPVGNTVADDDDPAIGDIEDEETLGDSEEKKMN